MSASPEPLELRCFCASKTLLAVCGRDANGDPFVHVRAGRSAGRNAPPKLQAEVLITSGVARIRCRKCLRWHRISIRRAAVDFRLSRLPEAISV